MQIKDLEPGEKFHFKGSEEVLTVLDYKSSYYTYFVDDKYGLDAVTPSTQVIKETK